MKQTMRVTVFPDEAIHNEDLLKLAKEGWSIESVEREGHGSDSVVVFVREDIPDQPPTVAQIAATGPEPPRRSVPSCARSVQPHPAPTKEAKNDDRLP